MRRLLVVSLLLVWGAFATPEPAVRASSCRADVEHISTKVADYRKKLVSSFRVAHDAGTDRLATVFFRYKVHYLHDGKEFVQSGIFRNLVRGSGKQYTDDTFATFTVEDILSVDLNDISCSD